MPANEWPGSQLRSTPSFHRRENKQINCSHLDAQPSEALLELELSPSFYFIYFFLAVSDLRCGIQATSNWTHVPCFRRQILNQGSPESTSSDSHFPFHYTASYIQTYISTWSDQSTYAILCLLCLYGLPLWLRW